MPLVVYDRLRVEKPIEDKVRVKCYYEAMMGEFSQFEESSVHPFILYLFPCCWFGQGAGCLVVDPVLHGWTKTLQLINYLLALPKRLKHKLHLILDKNCQICEAGV